VNFHSSPQNNRLNLVLREIGIQTAGEFRPTVMRHLGIKVMLEMVEMIECNAGEHPATKEAGLMERIRAAGIVWNVAGNEWKDPAARDMSPAYATGTTVYCAAQIVRTIRQAIAAPSASAQRLMWLRFDFTAHHQSCGCVITPESSACHQE
jgi:hypothetical protein